MGSACPTSMILLIVPAWRGVGEDRSSLMRWAFEKAWKRSQAPWRLLASRHMVGPTGLTSLSSGTAPGRQTLTCDPRYQYRRAPQSRKTRPAPAVQCSRMNEGYWPTLHQNASRRRGQIRFDPCPAGNPASVRPRGPRAAQGQFPDGDQVPLRKKFSTAAAASSGTYLSLPGDAGAGRRDGRSMSSISSARSSRKIGDRFAYIDAGDLRDHVVQAFKVLHVPVVYTEMPAPSSS